MRTLNLRDNIATRVTKSRLLAPRVSSIRSSHQRVKRASKKLGSPLKNQGRLLWLVELLKLSQLSKSLTPKSAPIKPVKIETRGRKQLPWWIKLGRWKTRKIYELSRWHRRTTQLGDEILHRRLIRLKLAQGKGRPRKQLQLVLDFKLTLRHWRAVRQRWQWRVARLERRLARLVFRSSDFLTRKTSRRPSSVLVQTPPQAKISKVGFWRVKFQPYKHPVVSSLFTIAIVALGIGLNYYIFQDLPSALDLTKKEQALTTRIVDRNGKLLYRIYDDENRTLVPLHKVSPYLIQATLAIEDNDFYNHAGFSVKGISRALIANLQGNEISQGGSTITQQLVKMRLLSTERTFRRKFRELVLAVLVEGVYTKNEILEMYFNQVAYGGSTYGVEEAAWRYFNKSASNLTLAESALLAGLPAAPSAYTPFGSNPELAYARQDEVFRLMVKAGYVTAEQVAEAKKLPLVLNKDVTDIKAPHFVMYVRQLLAEQYGEDVLTKGGLEVKTTLDLDVQNQTQKLVTDEMATLVRMNINNGAALVTNPRTGEILAMVGSKNYFDFKNDGQVNVTMRARQPGSSIKPFTYALALQQGKTPASIIQDEPITYISAGSKPYSPKNYDGKYHGSVTIREALGSSYNIPAVKTLNEIGLNNFIDLAQSLGINTWNDRSRFGLSLTLGSGEVRMIDLAQAYSVFPNSGHSVAPSPLLEVRNYRGELLYHNECALDQTNCWQGEPIISPLVAYQITDILKDNRARTPAFGPNSVLFIPDQQVAVKTGTTNSMRDNWTLGYTSERLVAVWVGNNDNTPMSYVASGITGASPIWNKIMRSLLDEKNPHQFALPPDLIKVAICAKTGTLPCSGCPNVREEIFVVGTQPTKACNPNYFAQLDGVVPNLPQPRTVIIDNSKLKKPGDVAVRKPVVRN